MTTRGDEQNVTQTDKADDERTLERILRGAGPREVPSAPKPPASAHA